MIFLASPHSFHSRYTLMSHKKDLNDSVIILFVHLSGIANNAVSLSGIVVILNSNESCNIYLSASTSPLRISLLELGYLFCAKYRYISLKYGLFKYQACTSFVVTARCVPFNTFFVKFSKLCLYLSVLANISVLNYWY